jgi:hypothetical protein
VHKSVGVCDRFEGLGGRREGSAAGMAWGPAGSRGSGSGGGADERAQGQRRDQERRASQAQEKLAATGTTMWQIGPSNCTVGDAVQNWLQYGLRHRDLATAANARPAVPRPVTCLPNQLVLPMRLLASSHAEPGDRASRTSGSGVRTVDLPLAHGEHGDAGDRSGRHRRSQEASQCAHQLTTLPRDPSR